MVRVIDFSLDVGQRFGRLTVIGVSDERGSRGETMLRCQCDCGTQKTALRYNLKSGTTTSCGCFQRESSSVRLTERRGSFDYSIYIGNQYGELTVREFVGFHETERGALVECLCSCGASKTIRLNSLKKGDTKSCGHLLWGFNHRNDEEDVEPQYERQLFTQSPLRASILVRDKRTCVCCNRKDIDLDCWLEVHHIVSWQLSKELRYESDNLVTLCRSCHRKAHRDNFRNTEFDPEITSSLNQYVSSLGSFGLVEVGSHA